MEDRLLQLLRATQFILTRRKKVMIDRIKR